MFVQDLFDKLSSGELTNLSLAEGGIIADASIPKIINYTNEALLKLYTRFILKEDEILLITSCNITQYQLLPRFSMSYVPVYGEASEPVRYIFDTTTTPFLDEVLKINEVFDSFGCKLPLNDEGSERSVYTPQSKVLQVPNPCEGIALNIRYQRRHTPLQGDLSETIECPDVLVPALTAYIAYKVFSHMNSADSTAKAQEFSGAFESICNEVIQLDLVGTSLSQTNTRFWRGGWI